MQINFEPKSIVGLLSLTGIYFPHQWIKRRTIQTELGGRSIVVMAMPRKDNELSQTFTKEEEKTLLKERSKYY